MKTDSWLGKLYTFLEAIVRLALLNLLWVTFNLPFLFFTISLLISRSKVELIIFGMLLVISIPIVLFPSTTAMFAVARMLVRKEQTRIIRVFWDGYKENYGRSFLSGIIFAILWMVLVVDFIYFGTQVHKTFTYVFFALALFLFMFTMHYFSILVHFNTPFFQGFKNALYITLKNPLISIFATAINLVIIITSYKLSPIIILLFTGSIIATVSFQVFYTYSLKGITPPADDKIMNDT